MMLFGCNISGVISLKCVSMNNQECKIRSEIVNVNSDEPTFYPYSVKINKCSDSCNNINDPYAKTEADLRGGRWGQGARTPPPSPPGPIFCNQLFFAITLKNYKLSYLKLN